MCLRMIVSENSDDVKHIQKQVPTEPHTRVHVNNIKLQLKVDNYIGKFHVRQKQRYGITYKNYSNVTFRSFGKVS